MKKALTVIALNGMILAATLCGCNIQSNDSQMQRVDSLKSVVEKSSLTLDSIDWDLADENAIVCAENLKYIQQHYKDTMTKEQMIFLSDYRDAMKTFEKLLKQRKSQQKDIETALVQLENLTSDLQANLVPEGKFSTYFNQEWKAANSITYNIAHIKRVFPKAKAKFEKTNPGVVEIVYELKRQQSEPTETEDK